MSVAINKTAFVVGEVSPKLYGHVDLARFQSGASTARNMVVAYQGGAFSRAGTAFVGFSKQTGRSIPPRMITFQFNINQGLALEFGNYYMRVVFNGAFVTEAAAAITNITQSSTATITTDAFGVVTATPDASGIITGSYAPNDLITLAGGTYTTPGVLEITDTKLASLSPNAPGTIYVPGDTITLAGGTQTSAPVATVASTQVVSATINAGGSGGTDGTAQIVTGTSGTGVHFQASVTISGGTITVIHSIISGGKYTTNPASLTAAPVSGAGLSSATFGIVMGVKTLTVTTPGVFTANPAGGAMTQSATSGSGSGATFNYALMAPNTFTVSDPGTYISFPSNPVAQLASTGAGLGATFDLTSTAVSPFNSGDWVFLSGVGGMVPLNGQTYVLQALTVDTFQLYDVYGNAIDSSGYPAYTSGGTAARIYTLSTIYAEEDLDWLKVTESADAMSICCVNQLTRTEYPPQDLTRITDSNWKFTPVVPAATVQPPAAASGTASTSGSVDYQYVVTSVNVVDGTESIASPIAEIDSAVDIAATAGTITITWDAVVGISEYYVYKATPGYSAKPPIGAIFGYVGQAYGNQFIDSNIVADFTQVPPTHADPFARGQIIDAPPQTGGNGYTTITMTINSMTGSGAVLEGVIVDTIFVATIVKDSGKDYLPGDTVDITGDGTGATAGLKVGAQAGTYPSVPGYFQERRVYANSLNNPDTYWMSQPGAFTNFDYRVPTIASDSITGSPWSQQVNGIQALVQTSGGLLVFTGLQAWLLVGQGSFATNVAAISPSSQVANRQPAVGCSPTIPPIPINYDVIYVQAKGSFYLDLPYQLYALSEPIDLTENSSHLFINYTIRQHAWCEQPYKTVWSVRNDGAMLSLTFYKTQQVAGWGRHDTQGIFESVCSVTEPPVDALYLATQRFPGTQTAYMIERMNNRIWQGVEDSWCVDAALSLPQPAPNAILTANSVSGLGACIGVTDLVGGENYSAGTTFTVIDDNGKGPGTGAVPVLVIDGTGAVTSVTFSPGGANYVNPALVAEDPMGSNGGSGFSARITLDNSAIFSASANVFSSGDVGSVIRMGGGIATITSRTDARHVVADISVPITQLLPNSNPALPLPQPSGSWTMTAPVTQVTGLSHLIGATVTGLADGNVITPRVVAADGSITLDTPASAIVVGLGFTAQLQSLYLDTGEAPTIQGQRKKIAAVTVRIEASRDIEVGSNQVDGSTLCPPQLAPVWSDLEPLPNKAKPAYNSQTVPLFTGDSRVSVQGGFQTPGQVCVQQSKPLPMTILSWAAEEMPGDQPELKAPPLQQGRGR